MGWLVANRQPSCVKAVDYSSHSHCERFPYIIIGNQKGDNI